MFPCGKIGGFSRNNQTMIKCKNFVCLSNLQFNYLLGRGTCPSTQSLCFSATKHNALCNAHECFCCKSCIALG